MVSRAEAAAQALLADLEVAAEPPVNLSELAGALGVSRIEVRDDFGDGRLEISGREVVIVLQARASSVRRRFTLAHELGHLWVWRSRVSGLSPEAEEHFCNAFASELLLPREWMVANAPVRQDLDTLKAFAGHA